MRIAIAVPVALLASGLIALGGAQAAGGVPAIKAGAPYAAAAARLATAGFAPVTVVNPKKMCFDFCRPETLGCAADMPACRSLFVRRRDGALFVLGSRYEGMRSADQRFVSLEPVARESLADETLILPAAPKR